jgi:hypothetical protein
VAEHVANVLRHIEARHRVLDDLLSAAGVFAEQGLHYHLTPALFSDIAEHAEAIAQEARRAAAEGSR